MIASPITTVDQLMDAGDIGRCELIRGVLIMMSSAGANHGRIVSRVHNRIGPFVEAERLGEVFGAETGFVIARSPDTVRAPDVAFVVADRATVIPERGFFPGAPDLAVEVVSPDDSRSDVLAKVRDWLDAGTRSVWVVDPRGRTISQHRPGIGAEVVEDDGELSCEELLPGFRLRAADVWA